MGKASRKRNEQRKMKPAERKILKEMIKESSPEVFGSDGVITYYNPLKKLLKQKAYKSDEGITVTREMIAKYEQFLKTRMAQESIANKKKNEDETVEEYLDRMEENNVAKM